MLKPESSDDLIYRKSAGSDKKIKVALEMAQKKEPPINSENMSKDYNESKRT
jgi:hypothetical protein